MYEIDLRKQILEESLDRIKNSLAVENDIQELKSQTRSFKRLSFKNQNKVD